MRLTQSQGKWKGNKGMGGGGGTQCEVKKGGGNKEGGWERALRTTAISDPISIDTSTAVSLYLWVVSGEARCLDTAFPGKRED